MIPDALIAVAAVALLLVAVLIVVVIRMFSQLAHQQQQIGALDDAVRDREGVLH